MFKYLKEIRNTPDRFFLTLMIFTICERTIFVFPVLFTARLIGAGSMYESIMTIIYIVLYCFAFTSRKRWSYISPWTLVVILFFFFSILFTMVFHPECSKFLKEGWDLYLKPVIPWFLLGTCFYADKVSMETIGKWCSFGVVFLSGYLLLFNNQLGEAKGEYDMDASYRLLLSTLFTLNYAFTSKNKWSIVASIIGIVYSIAMGTRGPVLVIVAFITILFAFRIREKGTHSFLIVLLLILGFIIVSLIGTTPILLYVQGLLEHAGFSTRVFDLALNDEILQSTSRQTIFDTLLADLKVNPMPHGLFSEKLLGFFSAHNMYIEILYYYGLFIGSIILIVLVLLPIIAYRKTKNPLAKRLIIMFSCCVFVQGIWGGRFLSPEVFFMLGFCMKEIRISNPK